MKARCRRGIGALPGALPALIALTAALPVSLAAQETRVALAPDSVRVGDVVHVAVRAVLEPGERAIWPDTLSLPQGAEVENAARVREQVDTLADGRHQVTAVYAVTPWRPGERDLGSVRFQVIGRGDRAETRTAQLPTLAVISVLPGDTAGIQPRPLKRIIGRNWSWGAIVLVVLAAILVALLVAWWIRRRRNRSAAPLAAPVPTARERALAALDAIRADGLLERAEIKAFYVALAEAVRHYAAALESTWSEDLTTTELLARFRPAAGPADARTLAAVLRAADQVKFARSRPDRDTALADWAAARAWVVGFRWPPAPVPEDVAREEVAA